MSSADSNTSPTQDDTRVNESAFNARLARLIQQQELSFMLLARGASPPSSEDSLASPRSFGASHHALEEFAALARVFRPMLDGRERRTLSEDYYSEDMLDPDSMSYEELRNLSETVGYVNKGLSASVITSLPTRYYAKKKKSCDLGDEQCTVCCCEFEEKEQVKVLPCGHYFHPPCIDQWLEISKKCPICSSEVELTDRTSQS